MLDNRLTHVGHIQLHEEKCMYRMPSLPWIAVFCLLMPAREIAAAEYFIVADLPGGLVETRPYALSADGSTLVGSSVSDQGREAIRWTAEGGTEGLGDLAGGQFSSIAFDVSADGSVVVGRGNVFNVNSPNGLDRAFQWSEGGGMAALITNEPNTSVHTANQVARDGDTIYGIMTRRTGPGMLQTVEVNYRWTQQDGAVSLDSIYPQFKSIFPISPDDTIMLAEIEFPVAMQQYLLVDTSGMDPVVVREFPPQPTNISPPPIGTITVRLATDDASVVAGTVRTDRGPGSGGVEEPYVEVNGARHVLTLSGAAVVDAGFPAAITDDGQTLIGFAYKTNEGRRPFIWTEAAGTRDLWDFFANEHNLVEEFEDWLPAFFSSSALEMSADGQVIAGLRSNLEGVVETYVVRLSPRVTGDANFDGWVNLEDFDILKEHFGSGMWWNEGDFDGDGTVGLNDFQTLKDSFGTHAQSVPEPATRVLILLTWPLCWLFAHRGKPGCHGSGRVRSRHLDSNSV
jgi:uncharacterized membrane protein